MIVIFPGLPNNDSKHAQREEKKEKKKTKNLHFIGIKKPPTFKKIFFLNWSS